MVKVPKIALFTPHESSAASFVPLFRKQHEYHITSVTTCAEIVDLLKHENQTLDAIVIPSVLADRSSAITACLQVKSEESLSSVPILVLSLSKDKATLQTFYGAGADSVIIAPFDAEFVYLQISALSRLNRSFQEQLGLDQKDKGLRQAVITALHFVEDALVIMDTDARLVFANRAARSLFQIFDANDNILERQVFGQLESLLQSKLTEIKNPGKDGSTRELKINNQRLLKANMQNFMADVRITFLRSAENEILAYCLGIKDISAPIELSNTLLQTERVHSLTLLLASGCMRLLGSQNLGMPGAPLSKVEKLFLGEPRACSLLTTVTCLLEILDVLVSSQASIRVDIKEDQTIAMTASDLFQLAGHLMLYAIRYSASQGETLISAEPREDKKAVTLTVRSSAHGGLNSQKDEQVLALIRGQLAASSSDPRSHEANKLSLGISIASKIARAYGERILENKPNEQEIKLLVNLPIASSPKNT